MRFLPRWGLRSRLSAGAVILTLLFASLAAVVAVDQSKRAQWEGQRQALAADAAIFETALEQEPGEALPHPVDGALVLVTDPSGAVRVNTFPAGLGADEAAGAEAPAPSTAVAQGTAQAWTQGTAQRSVGGVDYLLRVEKVTSKGGEWAVATARSLSEAQHSLTALGWGLALGVGGLTVLVGVLAWVLTGFALRPVTRLRRSAEAIVATGEDALLDPGPQRDEISELAGTLNELLGGLRAAAQRERTLLSDASHELRTPLAVLSARVELLRAEATPEQGPALQAVTAALDRLTALVTGLLELSRLDAAGSERSTVRALAAEAGEAVDRARLRAGGSDVDLSIVGEFPSEAEVGIGVITYGRVLDNLLGNALHALGGAGRVELSLKVAEGRLLTYVLDDGPGLPAGFEAVAFDRFSRPEGHGAGAGAGLGLAIVAAAAKAAGGTASLRPRPGGGTEAEVSLALL